jgi:hypothetical protein
MTATLSGSTAALKYLYPKGEMPKSINQMFNTLKRIKKETDFVGDSAFVPLQNSNPQGVSSSFSEAQANIFQGNYARFQLTRVSHYAIARISGEAAEAAVKTEGALVDLWDNESKGVATSEMSCLATYLFGSGDGVLGQMSSGHTTTTVTMASGTNMNYFELNMTVKAVTATGLASTIRSGGAAKARITGIDRRARTLTFSAALNTLITDVAATDYLVRSSDHHTSGVASVITGMDELVRGGTAPGTIWGLNRNTDPVRFAGQRVSYAGWAMEDALVDASAQVGFQGIGYPNVAIMNNIEFASIKKSLAAKLSYNRPGGKSAEYSFSDISIEGENGPIELLPDPFCPRNQCFLVALDKFSLWSLKAAPHLAEFDGIQVLRRHDADTYEIRFVFYGQLKCVNPGPHIVLTSFGL